ncbi:hypothetical protein JOQ06_012992 [Pogonophryne albipinna]|uniref:Transcription elongation factor 1 homolog n=1 Tax=Pogonophryne albipinna TaxID=1090488 RepID=A0AAD6BLM1_9TELE|nr:hypothetical protein JOQ06_012992 [Pogonophryne albipinna]
MGRRKSKRKPPTKKKLSDLDSQFTCPFCNHEKSYRMQNHKWLRPRQRQDRQEMETETERTLGCCLHITA